MPFKSKKQQAWAHTPEGEKALGGEENVHEWDTSTDEDDLPEYAKKKRKSLLTVELPKRTR